MNYVKLAFGPIFQKQRKLAKLSQEELALNCDLSRNFISLIENKQTIPSIETLFVLAEQMGTTADALLKKVRFAIEEIKKAEQEA